MEKFHELAQSDEASSSALEAANHIINFHWNFYDELQGDEQGLIAATEKIVIPFFDSNGDLREATRWKNECESMMNEIMKVASADDIALEEVSKQNERRDYLDHLNKTHLWLNRA